MTMSPLDQYIAALETRLDVETAAASQSRPTSENDLVESDAYLAGMQAALDEAYTYQRANLPTGGTK